MSAVTVPYMGRAGSMRVLPSPNGPISATPSRGDVAHGLLSGGTSVTGRLAVKKQYSLPYVGLPATDANTLLGFYQRLFGNGPFVFVDPSAVNVLSLDVSSCGARSQAASGWAVTAGALASAAGGPTGAADSAVLTWSGLTASAALMPGLAGAVCDVTTAPVNLLPESCTISLYMLASAAASVTLQMAGFSTTGAAVSTAPNVAASLTTSWQRFTVTGGPGTPGATAAFLLPRVVLGATVPASISIAGVQVEYGTVATAWQPGLGSPRVLPSTTPGRELQQAAGQPSDHTLTLVEQ